MTNPEIPEDPSASLDDPTTSAQALRLIAAYFPELRARVAAHPNAYEGLIGWLEEKGDPEVLAVIAARRGEVAGSPLPPAPADEGGAGEPEGPEEPEDLLEEDSSEALEETAAMPSIEAPVVDTPQGPAPSDATEVLPSVPGAPAPVIRRSIFAPTASAGIGAEPSKAENPLDAPVVLPAPGPGDEPLAVRDPHAPASPSGGPVAQDAQPEQGSGQEGRTRGLLIGLLVLVLLLLVAAAFALFGGGNRGAGTGAETQSAPTSAQSGQSQSGSVAPSEGDAAQSEEQAPLYPAPERAMETSAFSAPSGNISCVFGEDGVRCSIAETSWAGTSYELCGDSSGVVFTLAGDRAAYDCAAEAVAGGAALDYGSYATNGDYACQSDERGVMCWDTRSGASFALARGGWTIEDFPVVPDLFPWLSGAQPTTSDSGTTAQPTAWRIER